RVPERALGRGEHEGVRRHHARRQLRAPQQRLPSPRPARQLDPLGRRRDPRRALSSALVGRIQLAGALSLTPAMKAIVLFAHGARDPRWAEPFEAVAARVRAAAPAGEVAVAFLELMAPTLAQAVDRL